MSLWFSSIELLNDADSASRMCGHGSAKTSARERPTQMSPGETPTSRGQSIGNAVSLHEKLLLAIMLLVVAGWIMFRLAMAFTP
jgi:hypothetical protein